MSPTGVRFPGFRDDKRPQACYPLTWTGNPPNRRSMSTVRREGRSFQIHLSTAIIVVLLAGGITGFFIRNEMARAEKDTRDLEAVKGTNQVSIFKGEIADSNAGQPIVLIF